MNDTDNPHAILAKGAEPATAGSVLPLPASRGSETGRRSKPSPATEDDPDAVVEDILSLLSEERFQTARLLAAEAVARFPNHRRLANAWKIFQRSGKAVRRPATEPNRRREMAWLRNPPASIRGKWVALVGSEMVAVAGSLPELVKSLRSRSLPKPALVHRVD